MFLADFHIDFDKKKAIQAVLFITSKIQRKDFHKIFKILYFSDRDHLAKYGRSITGDYYIAMIDGPVPSKIYDIFKSIRGDGYFKDNGEFSEFFSVEDWDLIKPKVEPNLNSLSKTDVDIIDKNIEIYGNMSWGEIREKSHDYAWNNTARDRTISFDKMFEEVGTDQSFIEYAKQQSFLRHKIENGD